MASDKRHSINRSATLEALFTGCSQRQEQTAVERQQRAQVCASEWNALYEAAGLLADEHSTL